MHVYSARVSSSGIARAHSVTIVLLEVIPPTTEVSPSSHRWYSGTQYGHAQSDRWPAANGPSP